MDQAMHVPVRDADLLGGLDLPMVDTTGDVLITADGSLILRITRGESHTYGHFMTLGEGLWRLEPSGADPAFRFTQVADDLPDAEAHRLASNEMPDLFDALRRAVMGNSPTEPMAALYRSLRAAPAAASSDASIAVSASLPEPPTLVKGLGALARPILETLRDGLDNDPLLAGNDDAAPAVTPAHETAESLDAEGASESESTAEVEHGEHEAHTGANRRAVAIGALPSDATSINEDEEELAANVQPVPPGPLGTLIDSSIQLGMAGGRLARDLVARSRGAINADLLGEYISDATQLATVATHAWDEIRNTLTRGEQYRGSLLHTKLTHVMSEKVGTDDGIDPTAAVQALAARLRTIDGILASTRGQRVLQASPEMEEMLSTLQHVSRSLSDDILSLGREAGKSLKIAADGNDQEADVAAKVKIPLMLFGATKAAESISQSMNNIFASIGHRLANAFRGPRP